MPRYQAPTSDTDRLTFLKTSVTTAASDHAKGNDYVQPATVTAINGFLPQYEPACNKLGGLLADRMEKVADREAARAALDTCLRDFWEVLKRRIHRKNEPAAVLAFYGLSADGTIPVISTFDQLVTLAEGVITGDADAVKAGHPAMANPDAAELQACIDTANTVAGNVPQSDRIYDDSQKAVATLRPQADELIGDVMGDLRYNLRKQDAPNQRRIMRTYGATFIPLPGETPVPDPTPAPTPPATPK
jgi:hypothetical protein